MGLEDLKETQVADAELLADDDGLNGQLIDVSKITAAVIFSDRTKLDDVLKKAELKVKKTKADLKTKKGRDAVASNAYAVARLATFFDAIRKDLVADRKKALSAIDAEGKYAQDFLKRVKKEVREPLDTWEAEQKAEKEKTAAAAQYLVDWDQAIADDKIWDAMAELRKEKERLAAVAEKQRQAQEKLDRDAEILEEKKKMVSEVGASTVGAVLTAAAASNAELFTSSKPMVAATADPPPVEVSLDTKARIHNEIKADLVSAGIPEGAARLAVVMIVKGSVRHLGVKYND
jgi:hypothetical protein